MQGNDRDAECKPDRGPGAEGSPRFDDGMVNLHELVRALAEVLVNQIVDAVVDQLCAGGTNSRNGYRERRLETCADTITMRIPSCGPAASSPTTLSSATSGLTGRSWPRWRGCTPPAPAPARSPGSRRLSLGRVARAPGRGGDVRRGRGVVACALLLRGQDGVAARGRRGRRRAEVRRGAEAGRGTHHHVVFRQEDLSKKSIGN